MPDPQSSRKRASLMDDAIRKLESSNIGDARRNVEWILCELLKCNRASLYARAEVNLPPILLKRFQEMIARRRNHEPLQYILGYTEFCGLRFEVSPDVLIPRPETEQLVEMAGNWLYNRKNPVVLDLGSGSGCIPIAIKHFNAEARVYGCDVSPSALAIAQLNANRLNKKVSFFTCNILDELLPLPDTLKFDLITSNPPYIPEAEYQSLEPEVLEHEPVIALNSGPDPLLFYKSISRVASRKLLPDGMLLLETHCDFSKDVAALLKNDGYVDVAVFQDLAGKDRIVKAAQGNN